MFGTFDNLIRLTDDLQKYDGQVDGILHRLERQFLELDPNAEFKVKSQRREKTFQEYIRSWEWDEAKYPKTRTISDNLQLLVAVVNKLDEEARNKTAQYNELKTQKANFAKKEGASLASRDLIDVFVPGQVQMGTGPEDDFIYTDHLTTVPVIIPRGAENEFLKVYESLNADGQRPGIVPMSARKYKNLDDKDGNSIWRVVVFREAVEGFKKQCREKRYIVRDFEYDEAAYKKLQAQREQLAEGVRRQHELVKGLYSAAWSDAMVAWIHIKAMRVFVESVLRFGMPPRFASFIISVQPNQVTQARKALGDILGKNGSASGALANNKMADAMDDDEEYFPYVSFSFTPFNVPRG